MANSGSRRLHRQVADAIHPKRNAKPQVALTPKQMLRALEMLMKLKGV
jgi:hypothetical protein